MLVASKQPNRWRGVTPTRAGSSGPPRRGAVSAPETPPRSRTLPAPPYAAPGTLTPAAKQGIVAEAAPDRAGAAGRENGPLSTRFARGRERWERFWDSE